MTLSIISHRDCLLHEMGENHPECPDRIRVIAHHLETSGLNAQGQIQWLQAQPASQEQILAAHLQSYLQWLQNVSPAKGYFIVDADTYMNPYTLHAAYLAAGSVVQAVDIVYKSPESTVFCNIRPPGHHAEMQQAMGFCFFNNLAIGVKYALKCGFKRVGIVDFDVHRGNGTEAILQNHPQVLMIDSYEEYLYPFYSAQHITANNIIQLPLATHASSRQFRQKWREEGLPKLEAFQPEIIFVSAGFDGHHQDPISSLRLTEEDYYWLCTHVKQIAAKHSQGRIISVLEGGYALDVLGMCVLTHLEGLVS